MAAVSIQTDEARHAQIGHPVLKKLIAHDRARAQRLVDKWFWRSFRFFAVVTGFAMDYLTPLSARRASFKEFVEEWVVDQFQSSLDELGLERPRYWQAFLDALPMYHHMLYASAYTYVERCGNSYVPYIVAYAGSFSAGDWYEMMALHEFNHSSQFSYSEGPEFWYWEATATYIEEQVLPNGNWWSTYVVGYSDHPERA